MLWFVTGTIQTGLERLRLSAHGAIWLLLALALAPHAHAADDKPDPHAIPVIHADIGPCSAEFTIKDQSGAPVYDAKIRLHIAYGFGSFHKLDLQVGTNIDGKARFDGLPNRVKRPLYYQASQGDREGEAFYDPADNCQAKHEIVIAKPPATSTPQP